MNSQVVPIDVADGRQRAVVENVSPAVDNGRFAIKRTVGDAVVVEADCFADGHDLVACTLLWRSADDAQWHEVPMRALGNDRWRGAFTVTAAGRYVYTVRAWVDHLLSWRHDLARRTDADDIRVAARVGVQLIVAAAQRAVDASDRQALAAWAHEVDELLARGADAAQLKHLGLDAARGEVAARWPDLRFATTDAREYPLVVDRERARFSAWYEMFPRSTASEPGRHGTFADCERLLPYVAKLGFDVLYLPPIHPIGRVRRKGRNNALVAAPDDVGSPWAIGSDEGGHTALHPQLGTLDDFRHLVAAAAAHGIEVALDIALQCAPDHPYVTAHTEWFRKRPDGSVQYAENPPKKYQDIFPFDFECDAWPSLWLELASVFDFWIGAGVKIFRVDNPHTKAFPFWEWVIHRIKARNADVLFLAEAFTRPKVMHRLAKLGFSQSYTYFAWRNTKRELTAYFTELAHGPGREYFRPNVWPNTPDILTETLQYGGRPAFMARLVLAATLAASYGIYGPAYELLEHVAREPGSEEYLDSEKYQVRHWDRARTDSLAEFIAAINRARRDNAALQSDDTLRFLPVDNEQMIAYAKATPDLSNVIVCVVSLDPNYTQRGWVELDLDALGLPIDEPFQVHDLITHARFIWHGARNFVQLDPQRLPAHVLRVRRRLHREHDFDYFM